MSITKYWLDIKDRIIRTNLIWDNFAEDNEGGARSFSDEIIGKSLFSFISGDATKMFVSTMIQRVRITKKRLDVDYRCDSPEMKRFMKMTIVPEEGELIRVENSLEKEEPFENSIKFKYKRREHLVKRCSMCQKLNHNNKWFEPEEFAATLNVKLDEEIPVIYTVCENCRRNLEQRVRSIKSIREHQHD